jgi:hypothetical protein
MEQTVNVSNPSRYCVSGATSRTDRDGVHRLAAFPARQLDWLGTSWRSHLTRLQHQMIFKVVTVPCRGFQGNAIHD